MNNNAFQSDNISADLSKSWHIPRPTLARSSQGSDGSNSSHSTQSARSGSLLLTAANLAQVHQDTENNLNRHQNIQYYLQQTNDNNSPGFETSKKIDPDSMSVASSMHFTVVNMNTRPVIRQRSFCRKHQLTILVLTMSALFTIGILTAICLLEVRARTRS